MDDLHAYKDMRAVYADTLVDLAAKDERVVVLEADLMSASGTKVFKQRFPERIINVGVAEANMVCIASGLSSQGYVPFANTFGCFATRRAYDQFFLSANYARQNVKLVGTDPGVTAKFNGGTHMPFCDIPITRVIPGLVVMEPADTVSVHNLTKLAYEHHGCVYMRLHRKGAANIYPVDQKFEIGRGIVNREGSDAAILATGMVMLLEALQAADLLRKEGISAAVIDMHTVKPLDEDLVLGYARKTGALVTCENGQIAGGLGGAVAEFLSGTYPTVVKRVGINDEFGEVGTQEYLQERYRLTSLEIASKVKEAIALKS